MNQFKPIGIVRDLKKEGRISIPSEIRKVNGWEHGTPLEIFATEEGVFIREFKSKK